MTTRSVEWLVSTLMVCGGAVLWRYSRGAGLAVSLFGVSGFLMVIGDRYLYPALFVMVLAMIVAGVNAWNLPGEAGRQMRVFVTFSALILIVAVGLAILLAWYARR